MTRPQTRRAVPAIEEALAAPVDRELGAGAWSYFGDTRAISHDGDTFTGWISTTGHVWVARLSKGGRLTKKVIFKGLGRDDHNTGTTCRRPGSRASCATWCR